MKKMEKCLGVFNPVERQIIRDWIAGSDYSSSYDAEKNSQRIPELSISVISRMANLMHYKSASNNQVTLP